MGTHEILILHVHLQGSYHMGHYVYAKLKRIGLKVRYQHSLLLHLLYACVLYVL